jgi:hypothetical protein
MRGSRAGLAALAVLLAACTPDPGSAPAGRTEEPIARGQKTVRSRDGRAQLTFSYQLFVEPIGEATRFAARLTSLSFETDADPAPARSSAGHDRNVPGAAASGSARPVTAVVVASDRTPGVQHLLVAECTRREGSGYGCAASGELLVELASEAGRRELRLTSVFDGAPEQFVAGL